MPEALPFLEVIPLLGALLAFGVLMLVKSIGWWLHPVLTWISAIPLVGGWIASGARDVEHAVIRYLEAAIAADLDAASNLLRGLVSVFTWPAQEIRHLANQAYAALDHLYHVSVHTIVKAFLVPVHQELARLAGDFVAAEEFATAKVEHAVASLERQGFDTFRTIAHDTAAAITAAEVTIRHELDAGVAKAEAVGEAALHDLRDFEKLAPAAALAALLAAFPALRALVNTTVAESGLDNPECRSKVRGVCTTDPRHWENLLASLVAIGAVVSLPELVRFAKSLTGEVEAMLREVAAAG